MCSPSELSSSTSSVSLCTGAVVGSGSGSGSVSVANTDGCSRSLRSGTDRFVQSLACVESVL